MSPDLKRATTRDLLIEVAKRMEAQASIKGRELGRMCHLAVLRLAPTVLDFVPASLQVVPVPPPPMTCSCQARGRHE